MAYQSPRFIFRTHRRQKKSLRLGYLPGWHANNRKTTGEQLSDGDWLQAEQSVGGDSGSDWRPRLTAARAG